MDPKQFTDRAIADHQINILLKEVAQGISGQVSIPQHFSVGGADILIGIAAYALYRWLKDYFDYRDDIYKGKILAQRTGLIAGLVQDGFKTKDATTIVNTLLEKIERRRADDPALQLANNIMHGKI